MRPYLLALLIALAGSAAAEGVIVGGYGYLVRQEILTRPDGVFTLCVYSNGTMLRLPGFATCPSEVR